MKNNEQIKQMVKEKYGQIASQSKAPNASSCCGGSSGCTDYTIFSDDYSNMNGYNPDADLGLGCGLPTEFAKIKPGQTVVDLGSGAGNDCFIARAATGPSGKVIGIDMTEAMIKKAKANAGKLGFDNVCFLLGDIENIPLEAETADVVISNCVLNLVPDKDKAFAEIHRILKPGGHFSISDVIIQGDLPSSLRKEAEMYAGCVAGAVSKTEYMEKIIRTGFKSPEIQKEKEIQLPDETLLSFISTEELKSLKESGTGIFSITVYAEK